MQFELKATKLPIVNLKDILVGTVFSGTIVTTNGNRYPGIFYKAYGHMVADPAAPGLVPLFDVAVVQLSEWTWTRTANLFTTCANVEDYRVLKGKFVED